MKKIIIFMLLGVFALMSIGCSERIDAGHAGIKVNLYGSDKGVDDVELVTGRVWYNPMTTEIYEYPTFMQNATWIGEEAIAFQTSEGLEIRADIGFNYTVEGDKAPEIFARFRKDMPEVQSTYLRTQVRNIFVETASNYTVEQFISQKSQFLSKVQKMAKDKLNNEGFIVDTLTFIGSPTYPSSVKASIENKIKATQLAEQKVRELEQAKADAEKAKAVAQGMADAKVIKAQGDAKAIRVVTESLTPEYIKYSEIGKWDGKLPQVTAGSNSGFLIQR